MKHGNMIGIGAICSLIAFGLGFSVRGLLDASQQASMRHELAQHREHRRMVSEWEDWIEKNSPFVVLPDGKKVPIPSALKRGRAELSADYFWPLPEAHREH